VCIYFFWCFDIFPLFESVFNLILCDIAPAQILGVATQIQLLRVYTHGKRQHHQLKWMRYNCSRWVGHYEFFHEQVHPECNFLLNILTPTFSQFLIFNFRLISYFFWGKNSFWENLYPPFQENLRSWIAEKTCQWVVPNLAPLCNCNMR